jgi:hypothetical protein
MEEHYRADPTTSAGFPGAHALIIAIAAYLRVSPLPAVIINDGREVAATLASPKHCGYDSENVTVLVDGQATLEAIRLELHSLASRASPIDTVMIYFSGHGTQLDGSTDQQSALVPVDCDPAVLSATAFPEAEFSAALARIRAQRLVVFIDACHAGAAGSLKGATNIPNLGFDEKALDRLA